MLDDHLRVNQQTMIILAAHNLVSANNQTSRQITSRGREVRANLRKLTGQKFDYAYAINELAHHRLMNQTIAKSVIPNTKIELRRNLMVDALVKFKVHWGHADLIVKIYEV